MRIDANNWYFSPDHGQLCQLIESQALWGETTYRVNLAKDDPMLKAKAKDSWYSPTRTRQAAWRSYANGL